MEEESQNISFLREMGTRYMQESFFTPPVEKPEVHYNKQHLQVAKRMDGSIYTIDLSEACRFVVIGATRCMPLGTKVRTPDGLKNIEDCDEVLSFNVKKGIIEPKKCVVHSSGFKEVAKIKTPNGVIECSPEHKWIIRRDGKVIEIETKHLKKTDKLLKVKDE